MKWGVIVYDGGKYYIGVVKYGVNLGFAIGGLDKEEVEQFKGSSKTMRHIITEKLSNVDEKKFTSLIGLVHKKAVCEPC